MRIISMGREEEKETPPVDVAYLYQPHHMTRPCEYAVKPCEVDSEGSNIRNPLFGGRRLRGIKAMAVILPYLM